MMNNSRSCGYWRDDEQVEVATFMTTLMEEKEYGRRSLQNVFKKKDEWIQYFILMLFGLLRKSYGSEVRG